MPSCMKCNDVGTIPVGDELTLAGLTIGRRVTCECETRRKESEINAKRRALYDAAGVPTRYAAARLTDLPEAAAQFLTQWVANPVGWVYLFGGVGTGKTHTAAAIVRETCRHLWTTAWVSAADAATRMSDLRTGETELSRLRRPAVLILDDLALRVPTAQQADALYRLIDYRYGEQKPTVITSNVSVQDLAAIPGFDRIADRIKEEARGRTLAAQKYRRGP